MPDTETLAPEKTETKQENKPEIASVGKPQKFEIPMKQLVDASDQKIQNTIPEENNKGADATPKANESVAGKETTPPATQAPELSDDELKAILKGRGIDFESFDKLKEKLSYEPEAPLTDEQKKAHELAREKRLVDKWVEGGGTVENYVAIKNIAESDVKELSISALKKELKEAKFNDEEIQKIIKERYYQIDDEEMEQFEDESDKEFAKRKKEYGANKLANRSSHTQKQAQGILADLKKAIESEDLQQKDELTISANIDEQFKTLPRKETYEIGEINGKAIPPIESEVPETELAEAWATLKNPAKRNNFLHNKDGSINYANIGNLLAENTKLKAAIKVSYHEGSTRTNAHWEKIFGGKTAQEVGVGGSPNKNNGQPGQPAGFGKTQRAERSQHN